MKKIFLLLTLNFLFCLMVTAVEASDVIFSITYYPVENSLLNEETPFLNGVVSIPKNNMETHTCINALIGSKDPEESQLANCKPLTHNLFKKCSKEILDVLNRYYDPQNVTMSYIATIELPQKNIVFFYAGDFLAVLEAATADGNFMLSVMKKN